MAQEVMLMGAVYSAVPAILLPDSNNVMHRFDDASITTATASDVASGKVFLASDGTITTGTSSGGGGSSSWTKVAETSYQISTTGTSASTHATWKTGNSNLWTKADWIYVRIRDTEGKRNGYFYGSDQFFYNTNLANGGTATNITSSIRIYTRYNNDQYTTTATSATTGYGVWADTLYTDGRIRIRKRYNSTSSLTVNSTYKVEAYVLTSAGGVPIYQ